MATPAVADTTPKICTFATQTRAIQSKSAITRPASSIENVIQPGLIRYGRRSALCNDLTYRDENVDIEQQQHSTGRESRGGIALRSAVPNEDQGEREEEPEGGPHQPPVHLRPFQVGIRLSRDAIHSCCSQSSDQERLLLHFSNCSDTRTNNTSSSVTRAKSRQRQFAQVERKLDRSSEPRTVRSARMRMISRVTQACDQFVANDQRARERTRASIMTVLELKGKLEINGPSSVELSRIPFSCIID